MIKTLAYFPSQTALNGGPIIDAMLDIFNSYGVKLQENSMNADAAIIWSVLWNGRMQANKNVYEYYRRNNRPVIIVEVGALYRGQTWKIAVNHITAAGYYGNHDNLDYDRPEKLHISLANQVLPTPEIVIAAQHPKSLQTADIHNMEQWVHEQIAKVRQVSDRPIVVRPHPRSSLNLGTLPDGVRFVQPIKIANTYDSYDMHYNCHAVINYNSGPGVQAGIAGCRPIVDSSSLAAPVGIKLEDLEKPYDIDRRQWLVELCHTEYTLDEIKRGTWLTRITPALQM